MEWAFREAGGSARTQNVPRHVVRTGAQHIATALDGRNQVSCMQNPALKEAMPIEVGKSVLLTWETGRG